MKDLAVGSKKSLGINPAHSALAILLAVSTTSVQAGMITSISSDTHDAATFSGVQHGFGGWNLGNINVVVPNGSFDAATGAYQFTDDTDLTYYSEVEDDIGTILGRVLAKDWPVGEPAGIKIVNDDFDVKEGRPTNCIMSTSYLEDHFLDVADPIAVTCSGPFQSHKRYKLAMLPSTVAAGAGAEKGIDLVFNVEADGTTRDYQVFQKINNWTDERLAGFTIQVGTGVGANFVPASDATSGVGVANLSLSVPSDVWREDQLAVFSQGLFGPEDTRHGRPAGFFDATTRAGFTLVEYGVGNPGDASGQTDTLTSGATLGSDYAEVPTGAANQFGNWLPNNMLPWGIFYDDDANPDTDDELVAWYGYSPDASGLHWMKGAADNFELVADATITGVWSNDPLYSTGLIDDLVNIGLNYRVTVGDISGFPGFNTDPILNEASFTIRITPKAETVATADPAYAGQSPSPTLGDPHGSPDATISLTPTTFVTVTGETLTVTLSDGDLNTDTGVAETASVVDVSTSDGSVATVTGITVTETGVNTGVFTATLPAQFSDAAAGVDVIVSYTDVSGGATPNEVITASSTALAVPPAYGTIQFDPVAYTVDENDGTVELTVTRTGGADGEVSVAYQTISGTAIGNQDYVPDTETLVTFADGDAADKTISIVLINDDTVAEDTETFTVLLSNTSGGATLGSAFTATVTITDTDLVDTDGDGIPDIQDAFPDDADRSVSDYGRTSGSVGLLTLFALGMVGLLARRKV